MTVTAYNPGQFLVTSETRDEIEHLVDMSDLTCSCEAALDFATRTPSDPCKHILAVIATKAKKTPARRRQGSPFALLNCKRTEL